MRAEAELAVDVRRARFLYSRFGRRKVIASLRSVLLWAPYLRRPRYSRRGVLTRNPSKPRRGSKALGAIKELSEEDDEGDRFEGLLNEQL